jgi:hypothetical protein
MDEAAFFALIDAARKNTKGAVDDAFVRTLERALGRLRPEDIVAFDDRLAVLVARAHTVELRLAVYIATGFWSEDGFLYFAHWLVAQGREAFERVVEAPDALADVAPPSVRTARDACTLEAESVMYAAMKAYEKRTGEDLPPNPASPPATPGSGRMTNTRPPELDVEALARAYPRLWARFRGR